MPVIVEILSQTGKPKALVVDKNDQRANAVIAGLREDGFEVERFSSGDQMLQHVGTHCNVSLIVLHAGTSDGELSSIARQLNDTAALQSTSMLILTDSNTAQSGEAAAAVSPRIRSMPDNTAVETLIAAVKELMAETGRVSLPPENVVDYILKAINLLREVAVGRTEVFAFELAKPVLIELVRDQREEVAKKAASVLALISDEAAQHAVAERALSEDVGGELKVSLLNSLAESARFNGNQLSEEQVQQLIRLTHEATEPDVRTAASMAMGALNLPANQARQLILKQKID
jgi:HEAT repeat protein